MRNVCLLFRGTTLGATLVLIFVGLFLSSQLALARKWAHTKYTIAVSVSPADGGAVSGAGTFPADSQRSVTATTNPGYAFVNWNLQSGRVVSTSTSFTFTLDSNISLVANFASTYSVTVNAAPVGGGSADGGGTYPHDSIRIVTATPNSGYAFVSWFQNGTVVSTSASYSFTLNGSVVLLANFAPTYSVSVSASPSAGGMAVGGGTFAAGSIQKVTATANSGYSFANWTQSGSVVSGSANYSFTLNSNVTLVANFMPVSPTQYSVAVSASPAADGTVSGSGTFAAGTSPIR